MACSLTGLGPDLLFQAVWADLSNSLPSDNKFFPFWVSTHFFFFPWEELGEEEEAIALEGEEVRFLGLTCKASFSLLAGEVGVDCVLAATRVFSILF